MLKIIIPVLIGLGVVVALFYDEFNMQVWRSFRFDTRTVVAIILAWVCLFGRDFGMAWRFRAMTDRGLSWRRAARVTLMCEFTSAVTPTAFGGSALGMVFMNREGVEMGRATTLMMTTVFLDELFFVVCLPAVFLSVPYDMLFGFDKFTLGLRTAFWIVYAGIAAWTILLFTGIFVKPHSIARFLERVFRFRLLRRWHDSVVRLGDDMIATSRSLRSRGRRWWAEAAGATVLSWVSRFLVVNALFLGFAPCADQLLVFGRQFVVWVVLTVSPTPGGSGVSEWLFTEYYGDLLSSQSITLVIALFWRIITYYVYLVIGIFVIPSWLKSKRKAVKTID